ncbi:uncharacterized protein LOC144865778 [Branchiostoma floridae x Branchiostoma japonicum]
MSEPKPSWSASCEWDSRHSPDRADLNTKETRDKAGGWLPLKKEMKQNQWLMRDLGEVREVTGVITQGRNYNPEWSDGPHKDGSQYVTSYVLSYGEKNDDEKYYTDDKNQPIVFTGNSDRDTEVRHDLSQYSGPVLARYVKFHPRTWHGYIAMRAGIVSRASAKPAKITCCSDDRLKGQRQTYTDDTPDVQDGRNTCHSIDVEQGEWLVYTSDQYQGATVLLKPGIYGSDPEITKKVIKGSGTWNNQARSLRTVKPNAITLYDMPNFCGTANTYNTDNPDIMMDDCRSFIIRGGSWKLFQYGHYKGDYPNFDEGEHNVKDIAKGSDGKFPVCSLQRV